MAKKFKWLTGDPASPTDVAAELAGMVSLKTFLHNIGATDAHSEENRGKKFERDHPLGEGNGVLYQYRDNDGFGYSAPNDEDWETENVMGNDPLYPGFVHISSIRWIRYGDAICEKIKQEREQKYAAHYKKKRLLEDASSYVAVAWNDLSTAITDHSGDDKDASLEWSRGPMQAWRQAQQKYAHVEQMTDEEVLAAPDPS